MITGKPIPADTTDHGDHQVIVPRVTLKKRAQTVSGGGLDKDAINRAEQALGRLRVEFGSWMKTEIETLEATHETMRAKPDDDEAWNALYRAAHDIRGQAATFGWPLAGDVANGLCDMLDAFAPPERAPLDIVSAHVNAVRAIYREDVRTRNDPTAMKLVRHLKDVRDRYGVESESSVEDDLF